jgi:hypothetical protein
MADEPNQNPTPPPGSDPLPPATGDQPQGAGDPNAQPNPEPTNNQMIPKHRFDEVNTELKRLREEAKLRDEQKKKEDEDRLKKQGEFEKLAQQKEEEAKTWQTRYQESLLNAELRDQARALGAVDPAIVLQLIDKTGLEIGDDGTVKGAKEAVEKLLTEKPFLKGTGTTPSIGNPSNPSTEPQQQRRFKASQLKDVNFYRENEKDILTAMRLGLIEDDTR